MSPGRCYINIPCVTTVFESHEKLQKAVNECLEESAIGNCTQNNHGASIGEWDVSKMTDMSDMFKDKTAFNADISKWNVAQVTNMHGMFRNAKSFNCDLSDWHVGSVTDMSDMFNGAKACVCVCVCVCVYIY